jgi:hypothetical protein
VFLHVLAALWYLFRTLTTKTPRHEEAYFRKPAASVDNNHDRGGKALLYEDIDEKPVAVARNVVEMPPAL